MNKNGKSITKEVLIGVLIIVIAGLIIGGGSIGGLFVIFNTPDPVRIVNNDEEVCPSTVFFSSNEEGSFSINIRNGGSQGGIFVELSSTEVFSRSKISENFTNVSLESWRTESGRTQSYDFDIKRINTEAEDITISVSYGCQGILCKKDTFCCQYSKDEGTSRMYRFTKESCS